MTRKRNPSGGAAAGGGFDFHARLGAIAGVHTLRGTRVPWTKGLSPAAPRAVSFETSGPGDDLALELTDDSTVEIQARKGLNAGSRFWSALEALCEGIHAGRCTYAVLLVCPNSSRPVREHFALGLKRIGDGRKDRPSKEQEKLAARLAEKGYDAKAVCARVRIRTVSALDDAGDAISAAHAELGHICADESGVEPAWNALCRDASSAIARRGRRTVRDLSARLHASQVRLADAVKDSPVAISDELLRCVMSGTEQFTVPGITRPLPTDQAWLPLKALIRDAPIEPASSVEDALADYRALGEQSHPHGETTDAKTIGTFRKLCVVVGGPGSGKSLLLQVLAREFARDSYVSVRIRLRDLAKRMQATGCGVEEGLFQLGLDGTGVSWGRLRAASLPDLVLLCDGLDECADHQDEIASGLRNIAAAHPSYRVVVTTRPIGYSTSVLRDWRHYELVPLDEENTAEHLATLCRSALDDGSTSTQELVSRVDAYLTGDGASRLLARSPLLLALGAAVLLEWRDPSKTKMDHYRRIFQLLERDRSLRNPGARLPEGAIRNSVLNHLGWLTLVSPLSDAEKIQEQCAEPLQRDVSAPALQALVHVEASVDYWEDKGLIERLRHPGTDLVAFIHKTFGEFAAARYLAKLEPDDARQLMKEVLFELDWDEILDFAPDSPLPTMLAKLFIAEFESSEPDESGLTRLVGVLVRPGACLSSAERESFLSRVDTLARSEDRRRAYRVGLCLTEHDLSCMPEAGETAAALVSDPREWSRLVGWAVLACHFPGRVSREALEDALRHFMERSHAKDFFVRGASKFPFGMLPDKRVFEKFVMGALRSLLAGQSRKYQDKLIAEVWQAQREATVGFVARFESLLRELGRGDAPEPPWRSAGLGALDVSRLDAIAAGWATLLTDVVPAAFLEEVVDPPPPTGLKCLGALFGLAGILQTPIGDESVWLSDRRRLDAVHSLLRAAAYLYDLPAERLAAEAREVIEVVEVMRSQKKVDSRLLDVLPNVDAPEVNWCRRMDVDIESGVVESLFGHPSRWVQYLAAVFLDGQLDGPELREACERILEAGSRSTLYLAAALTADLPGGSEMLIRRLEGRSVVGLHHLFDCLEEHGCRISASHLAALENGLVNCGAKTAVSAARWCQSAASKADTWLLDALQSASNYWVEKEEPYPKGGGGVPDSPREALLRTRCMIVMPAFDELVGLAGDSRPDVAGAAIDGIVELATKSPEDRLKLVEGILGKRFSARQCGTLLGSSVPYATEELSNLCGLCGDPDPAFRSVAVRSVLDHPQMNPKEALAVADSMRSDADGNVRDNVHRFLERKAKERP